MTKNRLPLLVDTEQLKSVLNTKNFLIVDICKAENYSRAHIPGAIHVEYRKFVASNPPVMGLIPDSTQLTQTMSEIGLMPDTHVIAYDDEGGGNASRFLYTLDVLGHTTYSLLNGGMIAWSKEGNETTNQVTTPEASQYVADITLQPVASKDYILEHLIDPGIILVDARSAKEYRGEEKRAEHLGHIPGAVNLDWMDLMDKEKNFRLKPVDELQYMFEQKNVTREKTVVVYCHSHHRSALTYIALKYLGYNSVKGYPGSWSDWGNDPDMPVDAV